jgi:cyclic dehypoxanthinyl futalosine synthase
MLATMATIEEKIERGERLDRDDALYLHQHQDILELGALADFVRQRKHPGTTVTYNVGRNINYTNVCWVKCRFCNFYAAPGDEAGYVLPREEVFHKIDELIEVGGDAPGGCELLLQGGLHPNLKVAWFEDLFSAITDRYPQAYLHALSATEILYIAHISRISVEETLVRLHTAGLQSIPGAGAEILVDRVRDVIATRKDTTDEWLSVHETAHRLGMNTTATMMYGSIETVEETVTHLDRIRTLQDASSQRKGHFTAFITWSFQPDGTELQKEGTVRFRATAVDYLRNVAIARLYLDNIDSIQSSYVTQGPKIAQVSLRYGVNDFGSTMLEENVVSAAGARHLMPLQEMKRLIRTAGFVPRRRDTRYAIIDDEGLPSASS